MVTNIATMKAIVINKNGGAEVFESKELPIPKPRGKEILVKVHATSINPVDYKIRSGAINTGVGFPQVLGFDVSGVVEDIGEGVSDFKEGDEVFYLPRIVGWQGSYAEYHLVEEDIVAKKPSNIPHTEAAAIPLVASTAWDALIDRMKIKMGDSILIHAGAGGVGSIAIQLAKNCGLTVFTTCSDYNADLVKSLGADEVINYKKENFVDVILKETGEGVDAVFDTVGGETLTKSFDALKPFGQLAGIVRVPASLETAFLKNITIHPVFVQSGRSKLDKIRGLIEKERLIPVINSVISLDEVMGAHKKLEKGGVRGKIVIKVV